MIAKQVKATREIVMSTPRFSACPGALLKMNGARHGYGI
jgi:hypothetical protein